MTPQQINDLAKRTARQIDEETFIWHLKDNPPQELVELVIPKITAAINEAVAEAEEAKRWITQQRNEQISLKLEAINMLDQLRAENAELRGAAIRGDVVAIISGQMKELEGDKARLDWLETYNNIDGDYPLATGNE